MQILHGFSPNQPWTKRAPVLIVPAVDHPHLTREI
jgi:hypothetical protein